MSCHWGKSTNGEEPNMTMVAGIDLAAEASRTGLALFTMPRVKSAWLSRSSSVWIMS